MSNISKKLNSLLDYSSKVFKTDMRYIFKGGSLLTLTQVTSAVFGFLMTIAYANYLDVEIFGIYKYILAAYAILAILALPGIDISLIDSIAKGNTGAFRHAIFVKFRWGLLATCASIAYAIYNFLTGETQLGYLFLMIAPILPFIEAFSIYSAYFNATKKYLPWTITEFLNQLFSTLALFSAIYFTSNIFVLVLTYFLTYTFIRFSITLYILKRYEFKSEVDTEYVAYGKTMSWFQIITRGIQTIDQVILFNVAGPISLAVFSIANAIPSRVQSVVRISGTLAFPKFSQYSEELILRTLPIKMLYFGVLLTVAATIYAFIAPTLFKYLLPKYLDSVHFSQALIFMIVSGVTYPYAFYLTVFKRVKAQYIIAFINASVKVICLIIFVPLYGTWGAVIGVLAGSYSIIFAAAYDIINRKRLIRKKSLSS